MNPLAMHQIFLKAEPTEAQSLLYQGFPAHRGYLCAPEAPLSEELFDSTLVLALSQTLRDTGTMHQSYLFLPPTHQVWARTQVMRVARLMFQGLKTGPMDERRPIVERLAKLFDHLLIGSKMGQMAVEPARWAAFGFQALDVMPEWLRPCLISV